MQSPVNISEELMRPLQSLFEEHRVNSMGVPDKLQVLIDLVPSFIFVKNRQGLLVLANQAFASFYGVSTIGVLGTHHRDIHRNSEELSKLEENDAVVFETGKAYSDALEYFEDANGESCIFQTSRVPFSSDDSGLVDAILVVAVDLTQQKKAEQQIRTQAHYDELTGLGNRNLLRRRVKQALIHSMRTGGIGSLVVVDLNNFRVINETLGHDVGDYILKELASRCIAMMDGWDVDSVLTRMSGDEFAVLIPELESRVQLDQIITSLSRVAEKPLTIGTNHVPMSVSIGTTVFPDDGDSYEVLLKNVDLALSYAKRESFSPSRRYHPDMDVAIQRRQDLSSRMSLAIESEEFELYFQPVIHAKSGDWIGAEALLRWPSFGSGMISPAEFIPIAEQTGLIMPLGLWIIKQGIAQLAEWNRTVNRPMQLAINLSSLQFRQRNLIENVEACIEEYKVDPSTIEFEITESAIMEDIDHSTVIMEAFYDMGIRLAIDDFGTGYSSLSYLKRFPIHKVKIDRSFVRDISSEQGSATIAKSVIDLGHSLGLEVVAEGVETEEQLRFLRRAGCNYVQGFYFSEPLNAEGFKRWLDNYDLQSRK